MGGDPLSFALEDSMTIARNPRESAPLDPRQQAHRCVFLLVLMGVLLVPKPGWALDGRVEVRGNRQSGGAGDTEYRTTSIWENYSLGQRISLSRAFTLQFDHVTRRQNLESRTGNTAFDSEIISQLPNASLTFRKDTWRGGLNARGIRKDQSGSGLPNQRDEHADFHGYLSTRRRHIELEVSAQQAVSTRESEMGNRDTREEQQSAKVRLMPTLQDELRYGFTRNEQQLRTFDTRLNYRSHNLQLRTFHDFLNGKGRFSLDARQSWLHQESAYGSNASEAYLPPAAAFHSLDDTPEQWDTLEADWIPTGALYDLDRDTPTAINLGDDAPVVRTYGGDYRNIILDFGETATVDELVLYVDTILDFPGLMQWMVFTSDDPEGRDWTNEIGPSQFNAVWFEDADGRQGWRFGFSSALNHRRVKIVNTKLGLTEPNILVTELEAYQGLDDEQVIIQKVRRHRVRGDVSIRPVQSVELQYGGTHRGRRYEGDERRVESVSHRFAAITRLGGWRLSASHDINRQTNTTGQDTDAQNDRVSLSTRASRALRMRVGWSRNEDRSWTAKHTTHNVSGDMTWRLAPQLTLIQNVGWGRRERPELEGHSTSWTTSTVLRGRPRPSLELELRRNDRWVSQDAGIDFTTFNTTELRTSWAIRPLLALTSQVLYQRRATDDVVLRNSLVWTPLPGGSMSLRFSANDQQDTRTEWFQRGASALLTWRPRPRLFLEGGIEYVLVKQYDERNTPTNLQFRGSWAF